MEGMTIFLKSFPRRPYFPEIVGLVKSFEDKPEAKINTLKIIFRPLPTLANLDIIQKYEYPQPNLTFFIMHHKIRRAINQVFSKSTFRNSQILNKSSKNILP